VKKLTVYFGENDRIADALMGCFATHGVQASVLLRGIEGFGARQHLHSDRLLTLSEDLPLVALAVDSDEAIESIRPNVEAIVQEGLVTTESTSAGMPEGDVKVTFYCGRSRFRSVVDVLHRNGVEGATVILGVDGTIRAERRRARFFAANTDVPLLVVAVGSSARAAAALAQLDDLPVTLERVSTGPVGTPWEKLTLFSSEPSGAHLRLIRELRRAGAAGATCLRGIWGYGGDAEPHGDRLLALRRRVPVVTSVVDEASRVEEWRELASSAGGVLIREGVPYASLHQKGKRGPAAE
jgi:PII-like signaling protein